VYWRAYARNHAYALNYVYMERVGRYGVRNRGMKEANFAVIRKTNMPAILTENLFITNPNDAALLKQESFLEELAVAHAKGIAKVAGLKVKENRLVAGQRFRLMTGTFNNKEEQKAAAEKVRSRTGWVVYEVEREGLRLMTGTFPSIESANQAAELIRKKFGYAVYIKEE